MTVRRFSALFAAAILMACGGADGSVDADSSAPDSSSFRVALLTPGSIADQSWNGGAYEGLLRIRDSLGASISHIHTKTPAEFEESFREYGVAGYALVFGHGFEFQDAAKRVAVDHPGTIYIVSSSTVVQQPNVAGITFDFANPSFVAGALAAELTSSGVLGVIGGTELPPVRESFDAFAAGARTVRPGIRVLTAYIGNWDDVSAGKEQALAQIAQGADIIFQNADAAGLGVFQAARETKRALVFGTNSNQNGVAPEVTVGSVVIDLPHAFLTVAREVREARFTARPIRLGAANQVVSLVLNPAFIDRIPAAARVRVDSLQALVLEGRTLHSAAPGA